MINNSYVSTLAGLSGNLGSADGTGSNARFNFPTGLFRVGSDLYISDMNNHTIRKLVLYTGLVTTLAGSAGQVGSTDATGINARFNTPSSITSDGTNLYITDILNHAIRKIVISSGVVSTYAGLSGTTGANDGIGTNALFSHPKAITFDGLNFYVSDSNNHTIRKIE